MADLNVTASGVVPVTGSTSPTVTARGIAGATITAGQVVYADPSANSQLKPAQATNQIHALNVVGVALDNAAANQPVSYAAAGDLTLPTTGAGSTLTSGSVYILSQNTAGNILSTSDTFASGNYVTVLGVASSATNLRLNIIPAAAQK